MCSDICKYSNTISGKTKPYMYTLGFAILNRSLFPCQDTPAVKATYDANVKVSLDSNKNNTLQSSSLYVGFFTKTNYIGAVVVGIVW